jgi:hypothetical protein
MAPALTDDALLENFASGAFRYFLENVNPANGLVLDTTREGSPCSIAVVGFALSCYPVAVERGWMDRGQAVERTLATLRFFWNSRQSDEVDATGYKGFYYHFLDLHTGKRAWNSELSLIDSAILLAGIMAAQNYFCEEPEIGSLANALYRRMDWQWAQNGRETVCQGWKPEFGFLHYGWEGYSEAAILYVLGLASPTYALAPDTYHAWTSTYQWENIYGHDVLYAGPLFIHQFSHLWIDFRNLRDPFMREKKSDYFENSRRATLIQRDYAVRNPREYAGYGEHYWGFTACDGPGHGTPITSRPDREFFSYAARGAPWGPDDGTIAPSAAFGSLPFEPKLALAAIRNICENDPRIAEPYRVPSGLNPTVSSDDPLGWMSEGYFGLDQGLMVLMIENYRSEFVWNLMRNCPHIRSGLKRAGFKGGWLEGSDAR